MQPVISFAAARARITPNDVSRGAAIQTFLRDLANDGRSDRTINEHRKELRRYTAWLDERLIDWRTATPADLAEYRRTRSARGISSQTSLITTMRVFYRWAADLEQGPLIDRNPAERLRTPKQPKAAPRSLISEEVRQLLAALVEEAARDTSQRFQRDRVLILTALYTGLRAAELAALCWFDVDLNRGVLTVRKGKGQKGRAVKLRADILHVLSSWRALQEGDGHWPVFALGAAGVTSPHVGVALVPNRIGKIMRRYAKLTGLPLTAHVLRHTFATIALRNSGNLYSVSKALGHAQLQQTMVYLRGDPRDSDPAVESLPGIDDW